MSQIITTHKDAISKVAFIIVLAVGVLVGLSAVKATPTAEPADANTVSTVVYTSAVTTSDSTASGIHK